MEGLLEEIGVSAGEIYNYLSANGATTVSKMKKDLDLKGNFTDLGIGWLAREGKVHMTKKGTSVNISLS